MVRGEEEEKGRMEGGGGRDQGRRRGEVREARREGWREEEGRLRGGGGRGEGGKKVW